jgi:hypothetical protein
MARKTKRLGSRILPDVGRYVPAAAAEEPGGERLDQTRMLADMDGEPSVPTGPLKEVAAQPQSPAATTGSVEAALREDARELASS